MLYDPFVQRALEPWTFGMYAGGQSILVGTPSGVTLAPEGGAHQSVTNPSLALEQPGLVSWEPAFAAEVEWILLHCMSLIGRPDGRSSYLRLSTRQVDQSLAAYPEDSAALERRRRQVLTGGYVLRRAARPEVTVVAVGALVTEALAAADRLAAVGVAADVVCLTSPRLVWEALQMRTNPRHVTSPGVDASIIEQLFPADRAAPMVTVLDGHPHTLAFLPTVHGVRWRALGVTGFGQSGGLVDVYCYHGIDTDAIVTAALDVVA